MAPSQLKQLKASIQARRTPQGQAQRSKPRPPPKQLQQLKKRSKSQGEELRRQTLLPELQQRHKVGGILDRRIGENDPTLAPEDRALQRFVRQRSKRDSAFNLEDGEDEIQLTHLGGSLLTDDLNDDFDATGMDQDDEVQDDLFTRPKKKRRLSGEGDGDDQALPQDDQPERKKTKKEVMEEVIAKSKLHKYERQQAKEDDDEIRAKLDSAMPDLMAALRGGGRPVAAPVPLPSSNGLLIHPDRAAQMDDIDTALAEKEYDKRLRQLAMDKRAQPTERTKTAEEKAEQDATRLKELEMKRHRRMRGEEDSSDDDVEQKTAEHDEVEELDNDEEIFNEASEFGLGQESSDKQKEFNVENEDDFVIDEDLVASGSDIDTNFSEETEAEDDEERNEEDDEEFLHGLEDHNNPLSKGSPRLNDTFEPGRGLAYTYACPQDHSQLLAVVKGTTTADLLLIIQRIRALYHPQLHSDNKGKLRDFSVALVDHLSYMASQNPSLDVVEGLIRHLHSLSRTYSDDIARAFRSHLARIHESQSFATGDLFILTAVGSIYPTSDHFHQVVTPAVTIMARWLGMTIPSTATYSVTGAYVVALCIKYQTLAKRIMPEALHFTLIALRKNIDTRYTQDHIKNLTSMMDLWVDDPSFTELFAPARQVLETRKAAKAIQKLHITLSQARLRRRPLELHHHKPLPIKTSIPKFEETFNPDKHYDPDRERAEASKLKAEYKREKKGALRELKKDASFMAREKLKAKKEADLAYETKQRRLIAEIQGEEGREANIYEREKRARKGRR